MSDDEVPYLVGAGSADPHLYTIFKRGNVTAFAVAFEVRDRVYGDDGGAVDAQEAARVEPFFLDHPVPRRTGGFCRWRAALA